MARLFIWTLALILSSSASAEKPDISAQAEAPTPSFALLDRIFKASLEPEQLATLPTGADPGALAALMRPEQKEMARDKLAALEKQIAAPAQRAEIAKGYDLLGFGMDAFRVKADATVPAKAQALTAAASKALIRGDNETAISLAAEALAADPTDENAFAVSMLAQRRFVPPERLKSLNLPEGFAHSSAASPVAVLEQSGEPRPPTPAAQALMRQVVEARRAGDMDLTLARALDAMRTDPTSPEVQELFNMVREDRAKQLGRVRQTLASMDESMRAEKAGRWKDAVTWAEKAAQTHSDPVVLRYLNDVKLRARQASQRPAPEPAKKPQRQPLSPGLPIGAGGLLLTAGAFAWYSWGRQKADQYLRDVQLAAAIGAMAVGTAAMVYGGSMMAGAAGALRFAPAGAGFIKAAAIDGAVFLKGALLTTLGAKATSDGYSYSKSISGTGTSPTSSTTGARPSSSLKKPSAKDPELQRVIDDLFQPSDKLPGGTAGAVRFERATGQLMSKTGHSQKAQNTIKWIDRIEARRNLDSVDKATAEAIKADLGQSLTTPLGSP